MHPKLPPWGQNGGLSLRKRSVMLAALRRHPPLRKINEAWEPSGQVALSVPATTSAPRLKWAHPCHICTAVGLAPAPLPCIINEA